MNQKFQLGYPEIAVSNEIWAVIPTFMSNSYSIFIVDMINVLKDLVIIIVVLKIVFEDNHSIFEFLGVITSVWFDS